MNQLCDFVMPGSDAQSTAYVPIGQWHSLKCLENGTVILECKEVAYEPLGEGDVMAE